MWTKSQIIQRVAICLLVVCCSHLSAGTYLAHAAVGVQTNPNPSVKVDNTPAEKTEGPKELTPEQKREQAIKNFNLQQDAITNSQSRLGDELKSLPGPNIDFQGLMRLVITWSASLAASVAIFLVVMRSFASISGTEETHNELKTTIIKVLIGLVLIFFSYLIVSFLMGIIWAGGSVGG